MMWLIDFPETSVPTYLSNLHNIPEERRLYLHRGDSLKSGVLFFLVCVTLKIKALRPVETSIITLPQDVNLQLRLPQWKTNFKISCGCAPYSSFWTLPSSSQLIWYNKTSVFRDLQMVIWSRDLYGNAIAKHWSGFAISGCRSSPSTWLLKGCSLLKCEVLVKFLFLLLLLPTLQTFGLTEWTNSFTDFNVAVLSVPRCVIPTGCCVKHCSVCDRNYRISCRTLLSMW